MSQPHMCHVRPARWEDAAHHKGNMLKDLQLLKKRSNQKQPNVLVASKDTVPSAHDNRLSLLGIIFRLKLSIWWQVTDDADQRCMARTRATPETQTCVKAAKAQSYGLLRGHRPKPRRAHLTACGLPLFALGSAQLSRKCCGESSVSAASEATWCTSSSKGQGLDAGPRDITAYGGHSVQRSVLQKQAWIPASVCVTVTAVGQGDAAGHLRWDADFARCQAGQLPPCADELFDDECILKGTMTDRLTPTS
ncbi:hypothetical protein ABBQ32_004441 [Trebouxia sp. C0010 RCD-2024]